MTPRGFDKPLYVLPFDHRASFQAGMFGWKGALTPEETAQISSAKRAIYDGFKSAIAAGVPKEKAAILVDERFGAAVLNVADADVALTGVCQGRHRMTRTYPAINRAERILWVVTGSEKAEALHRLMKGDTSIPAGSVSHEQALVLADRAAARNLNDKNARGG